MRHKAGQVFLDTLQKGTKIGKSVKVMSNTIYLQDDEAVVRMMQEIHRQKKGDLLARLQKSTYAGQDMIQVKQFK